MGFGDMEVGVVRPWVDMQESRVCPVTASFLRKTGLLLLQFSMTKVQVYGEEGLDFIFWLINLCSRNFAAQEELEDALPRPAITQGCSL